MPQPSSKTAIVVGASSGIGRELVLQLAADGWRVAALARRVQLIEAMTEESAGRIFPYKHDVTDIDAIPALFQRVTGEIGGCDLFIYCAGIMPEVGRHEYPTEKDVLMIDVNITGAVAWLNQAAQRMENTRTGSLVAIGSVAGDRGRMGQPVYNASKAFLATYMEALRNRLARYGVKVVTIKPGPVETDMTAHLHFKNAMSAKDAAARTLKKINKTGEHYLNPVHAIAFFIIRNMPSWIFRRLSV